MIGCCEHPASARMLLLVRTLCCISIAAVVGILTAATPLAVLVSAVIAASLFLLFVRPATGVYLLAFVYSLFSFHFSIRNDRNYEIVVHFVQLVALPVFLAQLVRTILRRKDGRQPAVALLPYERWAWLFAAAFVVWSGFTIFMSDNLPGAAAGWWQFNCNFLIIGILLMHLRTYDDFVKLVAVYAAAAVCFALSAIYATYYAFRSDYVIAHLGPFSISFAASLFNQAGGFAASAVGMVVGYGCAGKHDLSCVLFSGTAASVFLFLRAKQTHAKVLLIAAILILQTVTYQIFSRTSVIGSFLVLLTATLFISVFRKHIIAILLLFLVLNVVAYVGAEAVGPEYMQKMETISGKVAKIASSSEYEVGNMGFRKRIWKLSLERISKREWLGSGPQSLAMDNTFPIPHAHNLILGLLADYGIPGCLMICAFLATLIWRACRLVFAVAQQTKHSPQFFLLALSVALLLYAMLEYMIDLYIWSSHLWFVLGLLWASMRLVERADPNPQKAVT